MSFKNNFNVNSLKNFSDVKGNNFCELLKFDGVLNLKINRQFEKYATYIQLESLILQRKISKFT